LRNLTKKIGLGYGEEIHWERIDNNAEIYDIPLEEEIDK
jgi:hypothetical protein